MVMSFQDVVSVGEVSPPPGATATRGAIQFSDLIRESEVVDVRLKLRERRVDVLLEVSPTWGILISFGEIRALAYVGSTKTWSAGGAFHRVECDSIAFGHDEVGLTATLTVAWATMELGFSSISVTEGVGIDPATSAPLTYLDTNHREMAEYWPD